MFMFCAKFKMCRLYIFLTLVAVTLAYYQGDRRFNPRFDFNQPLYRRGHNGGKGDQMTEEDAKRMAYKRELARDFLDFLFREKASDYYPFQTIDRSKEKESDTSLVRDGKIELKPEKEMVGIPLSQDEKKELEPEKEKVGNPLTQDEKKELKPEKEKMVNPLAQDEKMELKPEKEKVGNPLAKYEKKELEPEKEKVGTPLAHDENLELKQQTEKSDDAQSRSEKTRDQSEARKKDVEKNNEKYDKTLELKYKYDNLFKENKLDLRPNVKQDEKQKKSESKKPVSDTLKTAKKKDMVVKKQSHKKDENVRNKSFDEDLQKLERKDVRDSDEKLIRKEYDTERNERRYRQERLDRYDDMRRERTRDDGYYRRRYGYDPRYDLPRYLPRGGYERPLYPDYDRRIPPRDERYRH